MKRRLGIAALIITVVTFGVYMAVLIATAWDDPRTKPDYF